MAQKNTDEEIESLVKKVLSKYECDSAKEVYLNKLTQYAAQSEVAFQQVIAATDNRGPLLSIQQALFRDIIHRLENKEAEPAANDNFFLRSACAHGSLPLLEYLLTNCPQVDPSWNDNDALKLARETKNFRLYSRLLKHPAVNPPEKQNHLLVAACVDGDLATVQNLAQVVDPSWEENLAFQTACRLGHLDVVQFLLTDKRVDPKARDNLAIQLACQEDHPELALWMLKNLDVDPASDKNFAIRISSQEGNMEVVKILLEDPRVDPSDVDNTAIRRACYHGHTEVVRLLLKDPRIHPGDSENYSVRIAAEKGHFEIVQMLLKHDGVNPADHGNFAIQLACQEGHLDIVRLLLESGKVDAGSDQNFCIRMSSERGFPDIVKLLLNDPSVDPAAQSSLALQMAAQNGHTSVVQLLLDDNRVDPSADFDFAIRISASLGHLEVVRILKEHPKVNPAAQYNTPLLRACVGGYLPIVEMLLEIDSVLAALSDGGALRMACTNGHLHVMNFLLTKHKFPPEEVIEAFIGSCGEGHVDIVRELLVTHPEVVSVDMIRELDTPLHVACRSNRFPVAKFLLDAGASWLVKDGSDKIPFEYANTVVRFRLWYHVLWPRVRLMWIGSREPTSIFSILPEEVIAKITRTICLSVN